MKRDPRLQPRRGDRLAKVVKLPKYSVVISRTVLAIEKRYPNGTTVVYTRRNPNRPCRCSLTQWKQWANAVKNA